MGYEISKKHAQKLFVELLEDYTIYAPKVFLGDGTFANTDTIRYGEVTSIDEIEFAQKSDYSFKEIIFPISQTLFYYTEDEIKLPDSKMKKSLVFLRSCDLHGLDRLDTIYLKNGPEDSYYKTLRDHVKFVLMGCESSFENCFCTSMGTHISTNYDGYLKDLGDTVLIENCGAFPQDFFTEFSEIPVSPDFVLSNDTHVKIPETLPQNIKDPLFWEDYTNRCIACGRCNFVCPTCTCFTMEDVFYKDNKKVGERRRVWASCHIDGFTDMAGGHQFRENKGQRMRFKVLHKISDYKERFGTQMCIGCGRCDDVCPEYISFSNCINQLNTLDTEDK